MVRRRTRWWRARCGVLVAILLALSPLFGLGGAASAQSADAEDVLAEAQDLADGLDPFVEDFEASLVQEESDTILITYLNDEEEAIGDFYLTFTAEAPRDGDTDPFDFGIFFRDQGDTFVNLIWASDLGDGPSWYFFEQNENVDSDTIDEDFFPVEEGSTYEIELAVIGDDAAFAINGEPVGVVDLSNNPDPGRIGLSSGIFADNQIEGDSVEITELSLFDLDESDGGSSDDDQAADDEETPAADDEETPEADEEETPQADDEETPAADDDEETPAADDDEETPAADDDEQAAADGDAAVSETYGFTITYDPEAWELRSYEATGDDYDGLGLGNVDVFDFVNGTSNILIFAGESSDDPEDCVQRDIGFFENSERYEFISVAEDQDEEPLEGETTSGDGYYTVLWLEDSGPADNQFDEPAPLTVYIECRPIVDGESMALIEHYAFDEDYNDQIGPRNELLDGIDMSTAGESTGGDADEEETPTEDEEETPVEDEETPAADDEETPTPDDDEAASDEIVVTIEAGSEEIEGEAVLSPSGSSRTRIDVVTDGAPEGALVVLQEGSCDDLAGESAFDVGEIDENGEASGRVRATPDELDGNYALTIIDADSEDYEDPLACGDIG
jgi:hypothetical protein